jgi:hypothetical protein
MLTYIVIHYLFHNNLLLNKQIQFQIINNCGINFYFKFRITIAHDSCILFFSNNNTIIKL